MPSRSRVVCVQPVDPSSSVKALSDLFVFHGAISRVVITGEVGFIEFEAASSAASAVLFDRTKLAGREVSVAVVEETLPEEVWSGPNEHEGEEHFERIEREEATSPFIKPEPFGGAPRASVASAGSFTRTGSAGSVDSFASAASTMPPPAPLPPPVPAATAGDPFASATALDDKLARRLKAAGITKPAKPSAAAPSAAAAADDSQPAADSKPAGETGGDGSGKGGGDNDCKLPAAPLTKAAAGVATERARALAALAADHINQPTALLAATLAIEVALILWSL